jgi:DNA-binding MarR family transcriptional regulator
VDAKGQPAEGPPSAVRWRELSEARRGAWYGFLRAHVDLTRRLDAELRSQAGMALAEYDVLVTLAGAGRDGLRMGELARQVVLSPSGITRLVERLERTGLVAREAVNRRVVRATLTAEGRAALARAAPVHLAGVQAGFLDHIDEEEAAALAALWRRIGPAEVGV